MTDDQIKQVCLESNIEACLIDVESPWEVMKAQEYLSCAYEHMPILKFFEFMQIYNEKCLVNTASEFLDDAARDRYVSVCTCPDGTSTPVEVDKHYCNGEKVDYPSFNVANFTDSHCSGGKIKDCNNDKEYRGARNVFCSANAKDMRVNEVHVCAEQAHEQFI